MRILQVLELYPPAFSGQGIHAHRLSRALVEAGCQVTVVTWAPPGTQESVVDEAGVRVFRLTSPHADTPYYGRRATRLARKLWDLRYEIDLIHVHSTLRGFPGAVLAGRAARKPVAFEMTLLGNDDPAALADSRSGLPYLWAWKAAQGYVALTPFQMEVARPFTKCPIAVIPHGVPDDEYSNSTVAGPLAVLSIGAFLPRKGFHLLLEAWRELRPEPGERLTLAGPSEFVMRSDDDYFQMLRSMVQSWGLESSVTFINGQVEPFGLIRRHNVFALLSETEGFGTVVAEAMACSRPVVTTSLGGGGSWVVGSGGVVVEDIDDVAVELARLRDEHLRGRMAQAAYVEAERFRMTEVSLAYREFYTELMP